MVYVFIRIIDYLDESQTRLHLSSYSRFECVCVSVEMRVDSNRDREASVRQVDISTELCSLPSALRGQTPAVRDRKNARVAALLTHIPRVTSVA